MHIIALWKFCFRKPIPLMLKKTIQGVLLLLVLICFSLPTLIAQSSTGCGCDTSEEEDCLNDILFEGGDNIQLCYEVSGLIESDLGNGQSVCGVRLDFMHTLVYGLEITLVSPNGTSVQLVGQHVNLQDQDLYGSTSGTEFYVHFLPTGEPVFPDTVLGTAYQNQWNNEQFWHSNADYTGSYYPSDPVLGLEDFDSGPANGSWCLIINNTNVIQQYWGRILDFEVIFCDIGGLPCCLADGGTLVNDGGATSACLGEAIDLDISVNSEFGLPDTSYYGYSFLVSDEGTGEILSISEEPTLTGLGSGSFVICGLSYNLEDSIYVDSLVGLWTIDSLSTNLLGPSPYFCGAISSNCIDFEVEDPIVAFDETLTLCLGDTLFYQGEVITEGGSYIFEVPNMMGCDSIGYLEVFEAIGDTTLLQEYLCFGESTTIDGSINYDQTGIYNQLFQTIDGCDSLVILDLTVFPANTVAVFDTICVGSSYVIGDSVFTLSGSYSIPFLDQNGCDSIVSLELEVQDIQAVIVGDTILNCIQSNLILDGSLSSGQDVLTYNWSTVNGSIDSNASASSIQISAPGTYLLEVSSSYCAGSTAFDIIGDFANPIIPLLDVPTITCYEPIVEIDASATLFESGNGSFEWQTNNGNILSAPNDPILETDTPSEYILTATDAENGCTTTEVREISIDTLVPNLSGGPDLTINCYEPEVYLEVQMPIPGPYQWHWETISGNELLGSDNDFDVLVAAADTFVLVAYDITNGCTIRDSVQVGIDTIHPNAIIGPGFELDCTNPSGIIDATSSTTLNNFEANWTGPAGGILSGNGSLSVSVGAEGTYELSYVNMDNGCLDTASVFISGDFEFIDVEAGDDETLDCKDTVFVLGTAATNPSSNNFSYTWIDEDGIIVSSDQLFEVSVEGVYYMLVENELNGCVSEDFVVIDSDQRDLIADASVSNILTCQDTLTTLSGTYTDVEPSDAFFMQYSWINSDGILIGADPAIQVEFDGSYQFVVYDQVTYCTDTTSVLVEKDITLPNPDAGFDVALDCETGLATLQGSFTDDPAFHSSTWYTMDGNIISSDGLDAVADADGNYIFRVVNENNGCAFEDIALVYLDSILCTPEIGVLPDYIMDCYTYPDTIIDASNAVDLGPNIAFNWITLEGIIFGGEQSLTPEVIDGIYVLEVINTTFDLVNRDTVYAWGELDYPNLSGINTNLVFNCAQYNNGVVLSGQGAPVGPNFQYNWVAEEDLGFGISPNIVSGSNELECVVDAPGVYNLTVLNIENGCSAEVSIYAGLEGTFPNACLDDFAQFDCDSSSVEIINNCPATNYLYDWSIDFGQLEGANGGIAVDVSITNSPAYIYLEVTDTSNYCVTVDSMPIYGEGQCFPNCGIETPDVLTCVQTALTLQAIDFDLTGDFSFSWQTDIGSFCGMTDEESVCVSSAGNYILFVTDNESGLSCSASVEVTQDLSTVSANIQPVDSLNCFANEVSVIFSVPEPSGFDVDWVLPAGGCTPSSLSDAIYFASCGGDYGLILISDLTGCSDTFDFNIPMDTLRPVAVLTGEGELDCSDPSITIYTDGSSEGGDYWYSFFNDQGQLLDPPGVGPDIEFFTGYTSGTYSLVVQDLNNGCVDTAFYQVVDNAFTFEADAGTYDALDCDQPTATLLGTSSVTEHMIYFWETTDGCVAEMNGASILVDCPGTYTFFAMDTISFCTDSASVVIEQDSDLPFADAGEDVVIDCSDDFVVLDGSGSDIGPNINFYWYTTNGNILSDPSDLIIDVDVQGSYYLVVENQTTDCIDTSVVAVINGEDFPIADAGMDVVIGCDMDSIFLNGTNSSPDMQYAWEANLGGSILSGANALSPLIGSAGEYVLTVTNLQNGCQSTDTAFSVEDTIPPIAEIHAPFGHYINCVYDEITLNGDYSQPLGDVDFEWKSTSEIGGDNEASSITALQPGLYELIVTSLYNNCRDTTALLVDEAYDEPTLLYELPEAINCANDQVIIDASGSFSENGIIPTWIGPNNSTILNDNTLMPSVDTAGLYTLIIRDGFSLCSDSVDINVYEDFEVPELFLSSDPVVLCEVNDAVLDMSTSIPLNNLSYSWSLESAALSLTDSIIMVGDTGTYQVIGTSLINGCRDTLEIEVTALGNPITGLEYVLNQPDCYGFDNGEILVGNVSGGDGPYLFSLDDLDLATHTYYGYLGAGAYVLVAEDINGCRWEEDIEVVYPAPIEVDLGDDQTINYGDVVDLEASILTAGVVIDSVFWLQEVFNDCSSCLTASASPEFTTDYEVWVQDASGCIGRDIVRVTVNEELGLYVPNTFSPNGDGLNDIFIPYSDASVAVIRDLQIFDRWGDLVFRNTNFQTGDLTQGWDGTFDGESMQPAVFTWIMRVQLLNGKEEFVKGTIALTK